MLLNRANRKALGLLSVALFLILLVGLYQTVSPSSRAHPAPQKITDEFKSGLNLNPPGQPVAAPGPTLDSQDGQEAEDISRTHGRVLDGDLVLHDSPATYPRLTRLSDGSILLGFMRIENPIRILSVKRSVDGGKTFQPWSEVTRCDGDCDNLFMLEVPGSPDGSTPPKVLAAFRNHQFLDPRSDIRIMYFRITVCESLDGGRTWKYLAQVAEKPAPNGLWEPFMRIGAKGEVQMSYSKELSPPDQDTMMQVSYDRGKTWSLPTTATGAGERLRDGMTGIAATTDRGKPALVMVFETTRTGSFSVEAVVSYDDGENWGHRHVVFEPPRGSNAGAPQIESFANGGLATVFMSDVEVPVKDWPRKATVKAVFGGPLVDGKIQWEMPQAACPVPSFWPGILSLSDRQLLIACEHNKSIRGRILEWGPTSVEKPHVGIVGF